MGSGRDNLLAIVTQVTRIFRYGLLGLILSSGGVMAEKEPFLIQDIRVSRDAYVNKARWTCIIGKASEDIQDDRRYGDDQPTPERLCEVAVEEAAKRGILNDLYEQIGGDAAATRQRIFEAAAQNLGRFIRPAGPQTGEASGLTCPLAFDAGYAYGVENPAQAVAEHVTDAQIAEAQRDCYASPNASTLEGIIAGIRRGQGFQQQQLAQRADASAVLPPVPDVRPVATPNR